MDAELAETLRQGCRMSTGTKAMKVISAVSAEPSETESRVFRFISLHPAIHVLNKFTAAPNTWHNEQHESHVIYLQ